ncbi:hypothetical protein ACTJJ0_31385 [Chitinophaga sp. 22321]|uniref:Uncharacterized protein n=1 Tax=Chitinophaga hostae TaxID=2831022 RepID=A0ABS5J9H4_9BACT|nr:hypothetical protein [Chitinophaga hostae]MBS0031864.1 hypothetical protein [Chitinophaga hostae]
MNHITLEQLFEDCTATDVPAAQTAIKYLEHTIEKHTGNKQTAETYQALFSGREDLLHLQLTAADLRSITRFLFFLLMNYPDRAVATARCLVKCYDKTMATGICMAIEAYWQQSDETTCYLTDAITYAGSFEEFDERVITLFRKLKQNGLPETRKVMSAKFAYYKKFYAFEE